MYDNERQILAQQRALIEDTPRTNAYAAAIARTVRPGDVVLDLGSGTGVLAILACRAGARRVFAVERGHMADIAEIVIRHNGCADRVTVMHARSTEVELPERANVLVTETLGNLGFDELILPSVLDARRRLLTEDARVIPQRVALFAAPAEAARVHGREVALWNARHYGIDFSPVHTFAANQVRVAELEAAAVLAPAAQIFEADLIRAESAAVSGSARFVIARDGVMHGIGGWFSATLADGIEIGTAPPLQMPTNWHHALLPLDEAVNVARGDEVHVTIESADGVNWRWRGSVAGRPFDHTTLFGFAPCRLAARTPTT